MKNIEIVTVQPVESLIVPAALDDRTGTVEQLPQETEGERAYYARCRWLTTLFYLQGMRISEVAGGQMGNFFRRLGANGRDQWWLETLGKGDKERIVPARVAMRTPLRHNSR